MTIFDLHSAVLADYRKGLLVDFESGEVVTSRESQNHTPRRPRRLEHVRLAVQSTQKYAPYPPGAAGTVWRSCA